jgi:glycerophosphoryl diester phosphodiesterase
VVRAITEASVFGTRPAILGHRGCGRGNVEGLGENTLESFLRAVELGVDWVEVDVRRTSDDRLVVAHNPTDDAGVFYADITGEEATGRGALRVEELLEALPPRVGVDFDLKTSMEDATRERAATTAAQLAPLAHRAAGERPVLVTTFDPSALDIVRELAPAVPRGLLTWVQFPIGHAVAAAGHLDVQVLAVHWGSLRPRRGEPVGMHRPLEYVVELVHSSGREFLAWCPPPRFSRELVSAGADALCVDDIPKVMASAPATGRR